MNGQAKINELTQSVEELSALSQEISVAQAGQIKRVQKLQGWLMVALVTVAVAAGFAIWAALKLEEANAAIADNQKTISEIQVAVSADVLCPLYDIFLDSYRPNSPQAKEDPELYERSFDVIENGARALKCTDTTRGND